MGAAGVECSPPSASRDLEAFVKRHRESLAQKAYDSHASTERTALKERLSTLDQEKWHGRHPASAQPQKPCCA